MVSAVLVPVAGGTAATSSTSYYAQVAAQSTDPTDHYANGFETYLGHFPVPQSEPNLTMFIFRWVRLWPMAVSTKLGSPRVFLLVPPKCKSSPSVSTQTVRPPAVTKWGLRASAPHCGVSSGVLGTRCIRLPRRYWYTASCPPQNVIYQANSNNWTSIGTGLGGTCRPNGAALW